MSLPFANRPVLVVGDAMLDRYLAGPVRRLSPEAPVPVVSLQRSWSCPGGGANVAASLAALGCAVTFAAVIGPDEAGRELRAALERAGVTPALLEEEPGVQTITKTRILSGEHHQLVRVDVDGERTGYEKGFARLLRRVLPLVGRHEVVCLADYDKGTLSKPALRALIEEARAARVPCLIDPKKADFSVYTHATLITPNLAEAERALGRPLPDALAVRQAAGELRTRLGLRAALVTQGADGLTLALDDGVHHFPAVVRAVADVTGAGDTVVATLAASLAGGWDFPEGCRLASVAAGIAVSKPGVYVVGAAELASAWGGGSPKLFDREGARRLVRQAQQAGRTVVFTNGCFDILHAGHLYCLEQARRLGDLLVVGLNSDASVKLNKGDTRPINPEAERAALLAGLSCVDAVVYFEERTPEGLIRTLAPDVLVKGGDYDPETMAGAAFVRDRGGKVLTIPLLPGRSTTQILQRGADGPGQGAE
jgi:D-beta-D-heptose 7-phosphate kinase/D-beta-D-heptose 1-phosphate adenosyltransferase